MKELIIKQEYKDAVIEATNLVLSTVGSTLGPNGHTVILHDDDNKPYPTKDGVSVINELWSEDPFINDIIQMIRYAAQKTADDAGDGTTTSSVLASSLLNLALKNDIDVKKLTLMYESVKDDIRTYITKSSKIIDSLDVYNTALVSANGDTKIAETVQMAFTHSEIVKIEKGDDLEDSIDYITGIKYPVTYLSQSFITNAATREAVMNDCRVLVIDGKIKDLKPLKTILEYSRDEVQPILIIVEEIADEPLLLLRQMYNKGIINILPVKSPGYATYRREYLSDIARFSKARVVEDLSQDIGLAPLGVIKNVVVSKTETYIQPISDEDVEPIIMELVEYSRQPSINAYDRDVLEDRINNLNGSMSIIRVGGRSKIDMLERHDRIEDAVFACSSALDEGVVPGGGILLDDIATILISSKEDSKELNLIAKVLSSPKKLIISNGFTGIVGTNIVDPTKVTRCAVENAFSVALLILGGSSIIRKHI